MIIMQYSVTILVLGVFSTCINNGFDASHILSTQLEQYSSSRKEFH